MDPNLLTTVAMIALMGVAFYFLILRPQRKRQAEQQAVLRNLEPGARVLTSTGIYATLVRMGDKQAVLEISPGVELTVVKQAVARVVNPGDEDIDMTGTIAGDPDLDRPVDEADTDRPVDDTVSVEDYRAGTDPVFEPATGDAEADTDKTKNDRTEGH